MTIIVKEPISKRGDKDARRHREKQKSDIIKRLPEIIAHESIITQKNGKIVKIPIKRLDLPHFKPKTEGEGGLGQGDGQPGDIIGRRPGKGKPGEPGQEPGEDYIETEMKIEEIIELMLEDIGLPKLEEKEVKRLFIELGFKIDGIVTSGPKPLLDKRATNREAMKKFWSLLEALKAKTKLDKLICYNALKQANGLFGEAIKIIEEKRLVLQEQKISPFPIFENDVLRYRKIKKEKENQSNAVIIAMMDVSGSMSDMKKYLARAMLFWLVTFLRKLYENIEVRFIIHHSTAKLVDEEDFFKTGESGGTCCYTAYALANDLIDTEYPINQWNIYVWHFSDGEDFSPDRTIEELEKLINKQVNLIGYGEVQPDADPDLFKTIRSLLWTKFKDHFSLKELETSGVLEGDKNLPLLCLRILKKEDILPALKTFLKKDRYTQ